MLLCLGARSQQITQGERRQEYVLVITFHTFYLYNIKKNQCAVPERARHVPLHRCRCLSGTLLPLHFVSEETEHLRTCYYVTFILYKHDY